jgi:hypothetical protein
MTKLFAAAATALAALAAPVLAGDPDAPNYSKARMESPMNEALPGASGAQHRHFKDTVDRPVSRATINELRRMAIAAGQTSSSKGSAQAGSEPSDRDKAAIAASREAFFARIRQRIAE